ncbi:catechol O-methyltransferase B-like [Gastrophryne carolinensis]
MALPVSALTPGILVPLCAGAAWLIYKYLRSPGITRTIDEKTQQALRRHVLLESTHGKPESVLETIRDYARKSHLMQNVLFTPEQDVFLADVVRDSSPLMILVLGTQCGYTAITLLSLLPPDGRLYAVEEEDSMAESAEEMILVSGFKHKQFQVLCQRSVDAIDSLPSQFGVKNMDLVLMDHPNIQYIEALKALTQADLLSPGALILLNLLDRSASKDVVDHLEHAEDYKAVGGCHGLLKVEYVGSSSDKTSNKNL